MKRIIVTPAGRKRYLEILLNNLKRIRSEFDRWDIWVNTVDESDIQYINKIGEENDFIQIKRLTVPHNGNFSISSFFKDYIVEDELYLRLDDDIVYVHPGSVKTVFDEREKDTQHFLLYGNIFNNAIISHIHQRNGTVPFSPDKIAGYDCIDAVGWANPDFCKDLHQTFFEKYRTYDLESLKIKNWLLFHYERVSINAISWRGDEFKKFNGEVGLDEEIWLSVDRPRTIRKMNKIIGDTLFVHFAFYTQRQRLEAETDFLDKYRKISEEI